MLRRLPLAALAAATLAACGDNNTLRASVLVAPDTLVAYALSGTSPVYPSGLNTVARTVVRVDGSASFDIAFDIRNADSVMVYPVKVLVAPLTGAPTVGLQTVSGTFESLTRAPGGYYRPDTAMTVAVGETFAILATRNGGTAVCFALATPQVYAKVVVDSVNQGTHTIHFRQVVDPNCGYRSFVTGLPSN